MIKRVRNLIKVFNSFELRFECYLLPVIWPITEFSSGSGWYLRLTNSYLVLPDFRFQLRSGSTLSGVQGDRARNFRELGWAHIVHIAHCALIHFKRKFCLIYPWHLLRKLYFIAHTLFDIVSARCNHSIISFQIVESSREQRCFLSHLFYKLSVVVIPRLSLWTLWNF